MTLDKDIRTQLSEIFKLLGTPVEFHVFAKPDDSKGREMKEFISDLCSTSPLLSYSVVETDKAEATFSIFHGGEPTRITFKGIPGGHEFNSLLLAVLNSDGKGKNLPDETVIRRIRAIKGHVDITSYVSLSCTNCPDVVQALNIIALNNPGITHCVVDGGAYPADADKKGVQAVPTVYANDELLSVGRISLGDLIEKLESMFGYEAAEAKGETAPVRDFDILVLGGGPAGAAAAIYAGRKGLKVGLIAKEGGGSVSLTGDIDNLITTRSTTGDRLAAELKGNTAYYGAEIFENRSAVSVNLESARKAVITSSGETFTGEALIIATGANPRHLGVPGETEYTGRGVAFCPHCDGPYFKDKDVVVVGGGNAGIEAAIDLSGICKHVTVLEFLPELKADKVLIDRMASLPNVEAHVSRQVVEILGDGKKVTSLIVKDRETEKDYTIPVDGVFVQIGSVPNSGIFKDKLEINKQGEIITDRNCRTSVPMVYAAGDVATSPYKQIVVAVGEGATASLTAFDDLIRREL